MAGVVRWSALAKDDLADAAAYIANDSVMYAEAFIDDVLSASAGLAEFPRMGHIVPEFETLPGCGKSQCEGIGSSMKSQVTTSRSTH